DFDLDLAEVTLVTPPPGPSGFSETEFSLGGVHTHPNAREVRYWELAGGAAQLGPDLPVETVAHVPPGFFSSIPGTLPPIDEELAPYVSPIDMTATNYLMRHVY